MKVLIADNQAKVRSALKVLLEQATDLEILGEAADIDNLLARTKGEQPGLILLDWELPGKPMAGTVPVLRQYVKDLRIIAMSVRPEAAKAALEAGVDAFVSKGENSDRLLAVIDRLMGRD